MTSSPAHHRCREVRRGLVALAIPHRCIRVANHVATDVNAAQALSVQCGGVTAVIDTSITLGTSEGFAETYARLSTTI